MTETSEKKADEKKPHEDALDVDATSERIEEALAHFEKEANGALAAVQAIGKTIEATLTAKVESRAVQQSKTMDSYEKRMDKFEAEQKDVAAFRKLNAAETLELREAQRSLAKSLVECASRATDTLAECRKIRASAGPLFGDKLEAMATQVAALAGMGQRLQNIEQGMKTITTTLAAVKLEVADLVSRTEKLEANITETEKRVVILEEWTRSHTPAPSEPKKKE